MLALLKQLLQMFAGGSKAILIKVFGMFAFRILSLWIDHLVKKQEKEQRDGGMQDNIGTISQKGADAVTNLEKSIKLNEEMIAQKQLENMEKLRQALQPEMFAEGLMMVNKPFVLHTRNIDAGLPILADRKWKIGHTPASGQVQLLLNTAGKRTLDIELKPGNWLSIDIEIT